MGYERLFMINSVVGAIGAFILLSLMLLVHELGHFLVAKRSGVVVQEFGFGYPPRLATLFRRGGTEYTINAIPLGGLVRLKGEDDPDGPGSFVTAPKRVRAAVLLAGAGMNLLLAVVMFTVAFTVGYPMPQHGARITEVFEDTAAAEAGLRAGDVVTQIDDQILYGMDDLSSYVKAHSNQVIELVVRRQGDVVFIEAQPQVKEGEGYLGVGLNPVLDIRRFPLHRAFLQGLKLAGQFLLITVSLPLLLLRGIVPLEAARPVGPVGIFQLASSATQYVLITGRWFLIFYLAGILNAAVALTNLLPLPGLDGGRLLFVVAEAVRGERVAPEREGTVHAIGLVLLVVLAVIITVQDVQNILMKVKVFDLSQLGL